MKLSDVANLLTEEMFAVFSDIPALKFSQHVTGTAAGTTSTIFPVRTPLIPLFFGSAPLTPLFFRLNAVNAAIFPVKAVNPSVFAVKRR